jgi:cyanophycinase-like exopeptidase
MLGYAIIGHKSQGAMISSKMMIHICESFAQGLVYVLLFRVTSWKNLKIVNNLQPLDMTISIAMVFRKCEHCRKLRY